MLKSTGASGVVVKGNGIQVIYGPSVTLVKSAFEELLDDVRAGRVDPSAFANTAPVETSKAAENKASHTDEVFGAHASGRMMLLCETGDEGFEALGEGVAVEPSEGKLYAPIDATVSNVFDTKHAIGLATPGGADLLLHIGIDTVALKGKYFDLCG